jgi:hypothetical protein
MRLKLFLFGILMILFSIPMILFVALSYFNCGFLNGRFCCMVSENICCISPEYMGCIQSYNSNMEKRCEDYCFELRSKVTAGININTLISLQYCQNNCSSYYLCPVMLINGTYIERIC